MNEHIPNSNTINQTTESDFNTECHNVNPSAALNLQANSFNQEPNLTAQNIEPNIATITMNPNQESHHLPKNHWKLSTKTV